MTELSKTAKAAQKAVAVGEVASKKKEERTPEKAIVELRGNRASGLHVSPTDVDMLLAEFDKVVAHALKMTQLVEEMEDAKQGTEDIVEFQNRKLKDEYKAIADKRAVNHAPEIGKDSTAEGYGGPGFGPSLT